MSPPNTQIHHTIGRHYRPIHIHLCIQSTTGSLNCPFHISCIHYCTRCIHNRPSKTLQSMRKYRTCHQKSSWSQFRTVSNPALHIPHICRGSRCTQHRSGIDDRHICKDLFPRVSMYSYIVSMSRELRRIRIPPCMHCKHHLWWRINRQYITSGRLGKLWWMILRGMWSAGSTLRCPLCKCRA